VRKKVLAALALGAIGALVVAAIAFGGVANSRKVSAKLTPKVELRALKAHAGAKGGFAGIYVENAKGVTLLWTLSFSGLSGAATAAQLHKGAMVVPLCRPCVSGQAGSAILSKAAITALDSGAAFVTVRTAKNAAGEIRGRVSVSRSS
jgi:hypothetical protein